MADQKSITRGVVEEIFGKGRLELIEQYFADDYIGFDNYQGQLTRADVPEQVRELRAAFPDFKLTVEDCFSEGEKVCCRVSATGTHQGALGGISATGKKMSVTGIYVTRLENGKIVEDFTNWDSLGMLQQLGVVELPPPIAPEAVREQGGEARH